MELLTEADLPIWLSLPKEYAQLRDAGIKKFSPWYLLDSKSASLRYEGLNMRYQNERIFAFAARLDNDDIACWDATRPGKVVIIHDFSDLAYSGNRVFDSFWAWFRAAIEDMIEF